MSSDRPKTIRRAEARAPAPRSEIAGAWDTPSSAGDFLGTLLGAELEHPSTGEAERVRLRSYYASMLGHDGRLLPLAAQAYARRLWPLFEILADSSAPLTVLDAGCGNGTEAYLMALLGHRVVGVELVADRAEVARSRRTFFESCSGVDIAVSFETANVFHYLQSARRFDVIWSMESISHIYPPERFLQLAHEALVPGGRLIISDPNRRNPVALWRSIKLRGSLKHRPHTRFSDPETGEPVEYGQEMITSPRAMARAVRRAGLEVVSVVMGGFMGTTLLPRKLLDTAWARRLALRAASVAPRLPLVRDLGSLYTLVAVKPERGA